MSVWCLPIFLQIPLGSFMIFPKPSHYPKGLLGIPSSESVSTLFMPWMYDFQLKLLCEWTRRTAIKLQHQLLGSGFFRSVACPTQGSFLLHFHLFCDTSMLLGRRSRRSYLQKSFSGQRPHQGMKDTLPAGVSPCAVPRLETITRVSAGEILSFQGLVQV